MEGQALETEKETKTNSFPLLELPPEIWSRICEYAVVSSKAIVIEEPDAGETRTAIKPPSITCTCRLVREEALSFFYKRNEFVVVDDATEWDGVWAWLKSIGRSRRKDLKQLFVGLLLGIESEKWIQERLREYEGQLEVGAPRRREDEPRRNIYRISFNG